MQRLFICERHAAVSQRGAAVRPDKQRGASFPREVTAEGFAVALLGNENLSRLEDPLGPGRYLSPALVRAACPPPITADNPERSTWSRRQVHSSGHMSNSCGFPGNREKTEAPILGDGEAGRASCSQKMPRPLQQPNLAVRAPRPAPNQIRRSICPSSQMRCDRLAWADRAGGRASP
ncbi:hypothetical protein SKAU_G00203750 [Synaphobranchus kaupii]|uniref:Uncharacterized protein n=1 Tax=Synaphobranchus kaupii TaxID=118154 RepID=A0A9Q1IY36_SYNKA|nr:hypothetical protein SKAU_G00203750 [Synaphobranchus kaupii]